MAHHSRLLLFSPFSYGGLFEYSLQEAEALSRFGEVSLLIPTNGYCPQTMDGASYEIIPSLPDDRPTPNWPSPIRILRSVHRIMKTYRVLEDTIRQNSCSRVLFTAFAEYLAPLWAHQFKRLRASGVHFGAVIHDPIRDFQLGPAWWHRKSITQAYAFLDLAFIHEAAHLDTGEAEPPPKTIVVPHGPYPLPPPTRDSTSLRAELEIPAEATLFLSFGHIRDGKNIDLFIDAMSEFQSVFLIVAGKEQSTAQKQASYYQDLANKKGVSPRCRFIVRYVCGEEAADLIGASDVILLTYSSDFHSASGVLNLVAPFKKQILASAGEGPLKSAVHQYNLGTWVEPDSPESLKQGIEQAINKTSSPARWDQYLEDHSWEAHARTVWEAFNHLP